jgi:hypothetical protein
MNNLSLDYRIYASSCVYYKRMKKRKNRIALHEIALLFGISDIFDVSKISNNDVFKCLSNLNAQCTSYRLN